MYPDEMNDPDRIGHDAQLYQPPRRVRQRLYARSLDDGENGEDYDDDDGVLRPRWTRGRILFVIITLILVISLLLLDLMPLLTQFWQSFPPNYFQRPDPTFIPGA